MKIPAQITFKNLEPFEEVEQWVLNEVAKLEIFYDRIIGCHVAIDVPHRHHRKGNPYRVRIDLAVPGGKIVVNRGPNITHLVPRSGEDKLHKHLEVEIPHKNLRVAITDAFHAAGRQLQDYARRRRGDVKSHTERAQEQATTDLAKPKTGVKRGKPGQIVPYTIEAHPEL